MPHYKLKKNNIVNYNFWKPPDLPPARAKPGPSEDDIIKDNANVTTDVLKSGTILSIDGSINDLCGVVLKEETDNYDWYGYRDRLWTFKSLGPDGLIDRAKRLTISDCFFGYVGYPDKDGKDGKKVNKKFVNCDFKNCNFDYARHMWNGKHEFNGCSFNNQCSFKNSDFSQHTYISCQFIDMKGANVNLSGAHIHSGCDFTDAYLKDADFSKSIVTESIDTFERHLPDHNGHRWDSFKSYASFFQPFNIFKDADLNGADLSGVRWDCVDLSNADLTNTVLDGATIIFCCRKDSPLPRVDKNKGVKCISYKKHPSDMYPHNDFDAAKAYHGTSLDDKNIREYHITQTGFKYLKARKKDNVRGYVPDKVVNYGTDDWYMLVGPTMCLQNMFDTRSASINKQSIADHFTDYILETRIRTGSVPDLPKAYLGAVDLSDATLNYANLRGAYLTGANLSNAKLHYANLSGADLSNAELGTSQLQFANLSGANLTGAKLNEANLKDANLSGADLSGAHLSGATLINTDLCGADLRVVDLSGVNLSNANLRGADLSNAKLSNADLTGADLTGANLNSTMICGVDFRNNTILDDVRGSPLTCFNKEKAKFSPEYTLSDNKIISRKAKHDKEQKDAVETGIQQAELAINTAKAVEQKTILKQEEENCVDSDEKIEQIKREIEQKAKNIKQKEKEIDIAQLNIKKKEYQIKYLETKLATEKVNAVKTTIASIDKNAAATEKAVSTAVETIHNGCLTDLTLKHANEINAKKVYKTELVGIIERNRAMTIEYEASISLLETENEKLPKDIDDQSLLKDKYTQQITEQNSITDQLNEHLINININYKVNDFDLVRFLDREFSLHQNPFIQAGGGMKTEDHPHIADLLNQLLEIINFREAYFKNQELGEYKDGQTLLEYKNTIQQRINDYNIEIPSCDTKPDMLQKKDNSKDLPALPALPALPSEDTYEARRTSNWHLLMEARPSEDTDEALPSEDTDEALPSEDTDEALPSEDTDEVNNYMEMLTLVKKNNISIILILVFILLFFILSFFKKNIFNQLK